MTAFAPPRAHATAKIFPTRLAALVIKIVFPFKGSLI
jgi:hypothetical protein